MKFSKLQKYKILLLSLLMLAFAVIPAQSQEKGQVTGLENGMVRINWGSNDGIVTGILFNVIKLVPNFHPVTREQFGFSENIVATLESVEVYPDYTLSKTLRSSEDIKPGFEVRISFDESSLFASEEIEKGTITHINNKVIRFNMGVFDGVEEKLLFDVYRAIGSTQHPVTGEVVEGRNLYLGKVRVINVGDDFASGQIIAEEREMLPGDKVVLSMQQLSDLEISEPGEKTAAGQDPNISVFREEIVEKPLHEPDNIVGTVTKKTGRDVYFVWRSDYGFDAGRVFGVYRREELKHPESGDILGNPLILIARITLVESIGDLGRAVIQSSDAEIISSDFVGLTDGETVASGQIVTPENADDVYEVRRSDILEQVKALTEQTRQIQGEQAVVRQALSKLDRIDRELSSQKAVTAAMNQSLDEIKSLLRGEGFPVEGTTLMPSRASVDRMEFPGSGVNVLRLKYTDDVDVKLELINNTLNVSLEVDSATGEKYMAARTVQQRPAAVVDTSNAVADTVSGSGQLEALTDEDEGSIFTNWIFLTILIVVLFGVAGGLYFFLVMKKGGGFGKKKSGSSDSEDDGGDGGGDDFEEFGDEEEGESFDDDDEIIPDEEEIETFDDD